MNQSIIIRHIKSHALFEVYDVVTELFHHEQAIKYDEQWYGLIQSRVIPLELKAFPLNSQQRHQAIQQRRGQLQNEAYGIILNKFPDLKKEKRMMLHMGSIAVENAAGSYPHQIIPRG